METKQHYVLKLHKMTKTEHGDYVAVGWTAVVERDNLAKIELQTAADLIDASIKGSPADGCEPMTTEEIASWREED